MVNSTNDIPLVDQAVIDRQSRRDSSDHGKVWNWLDAVCDPEIPVLSLWEMGILQDVSVLMDAEGQLDEVVVVLTPTYSGCPALSVMQEDVQSCLHDQGVANVRVELQTSPPWGTHYMNPQAKAKLRAFHMAAPNELSCPQCNSASVELISEFSATACKAMYKCKQCLEPFEYFKPF